MRAYKKLYLVGLTTALLLVGCGDKLPELSEEQESLVVEYAAGLVLKYDKNYSGRLVATKEEESPLEETPIETTPEDVGETVETPTQEETPMQDKEPEIVRAVDANAGDLTSFFGIEGVTVSYSGYEVTPNYPQDDVLAAGFAMGATQGNQLLVLKFNVTNANTEASEVNFISKNPRFRIAVNGEGSKGALATLLMDDMATYKETLQAGETKEAVLVVEVKDETAQSIQAVEVIAKIGENTITTKLF